MNNEILVKLALVAWKTKDVDAAAMFAIISGKLRGCTERELRQYPGFRYMAIDANGAFPMPDADLVAKANEAARAFLLSISAKEFLDV